MTSNACRQKYDFYIEWATKCRQHDNSEGFFLFSFKLLKEEKFKFGKDSVGSAFLCSPFLVLKNNLYLLYYKALGQNCVTRNLGNGAAYHDIWYTKMFSIHRRWFMAYRTSLLKAIGCKKGQNRFCPAATGRTGQNWAADLGRLP